MISSRPGEAAVASANSFMPADLYLRLRIAEGRIYPDEIVSGLPDFPADHPLKREWLARADSASRLLKYVAAMFGPLRILDVGCGNGWLSRALSTIPGVHVWGFDRSGPELSQASRLFGSPNTVFSALDIAQAPFPMQSFDVIVLASVIQYFPDLAFVIRLLQGHLRPLGEIHIMDSPLYLDSEVGAAQARSAAYYSSLGFPDMAHFYFHHCFSSLDQFHPARLYDPRSLGPRFLNQKRGAASPFPWLRIRTAA